MKTARVEEKEEKGEGRKSPVAGAIAFSEDTTNRRAGEEEVVDVSDEELIAIARSWILRALASAAANEGGGGEDNGHYTKLLSDLRNPRLNSPANASAMCIRLTALAQTVSYLDQNKHQALLTYLLGMSLWLYSEEVVEALLKFVTNLATVSGSFVPQCLDMLVRNFLPPSCGLLAFLDSFTRAGLMTGTFNMEKLRMQASQHIAKKDGVTFSLSLSPLLLLPSSVFFMHSLCLYWLEESSTSLQNSAAGQESSCVGAYSGFNF
jgi:RNA polymerase I-specific transcription initiation factor RRN3